MKPCSLPQIWLHWPRYVPGVSMVNHASLMNPGMPYWLMPSCGTYQPWITSLEVMSKRTFLPTGTTMGLSTSRR